MNERDYGDQNFCLACGYDFGSVLDENNQDICPCCGCQIGYNYLYDGRGAKRCRGEWLNEGAKWFDPEKKPKNWNVNVQLKNIPKELL